MAGALWATEEQRSAQNERLKNKWTRMAPSNDYGMGGLTTRMGLSGGGAGAGVGKPRPYVGETDLGSDVGRKRPTGGWDWLGVRGG